MTPATPSEPASSGGREPREARAAELSAANDRLRAEVADRRRVQEELRRTEERYDLATQAAMVGVWDWNLKTGEFYLDPRVKEILGYTDGEIPNDLEQWTQYVHPDDLEAVMQAAQDHLDGKTPDYVFRHRMLHKDGGVRWIMVRGRAIRDENGDVVRMLGTDIDITDQWRVEETLRRREAILEAVGRASERFLREESWEEATPALLDDLGRAVGASRVYLFSREPAAGERLVVRQRQEWVAKGVPLAHYDRELREFAAGSAGFQFLDKLLVGGLPMCGRFEDFSADLQALLSKQGIRSIATVPVFVGAEAWGFLGFDDCAESRLWSDAEIDALRAASAIVGGAIERARAESERLRIEQQMQSVQNVESLSVLARGIAHDFNNLLAGVLGNASLALDELPPGSSAWQLVEQIRLSAERAADLSARLLNLSGKEHLRMQATDAGQVLRDVAELLRSSIARHARLELELPEDLPAIRADVTQLSQVVMNLILNASEALEPPGGRIVLRAGVESWERSQLDGLRLGENCASGDYVFLEVADDGRGMHPETLSRIFDPYFSTKSTGRGLGLASVPGIVRTHAGALEVRSEPGRGTFFHLIFPVHSELAPASRTREQRASKWRGEGTVLVVDDEESVLRVGRAMLERLGFRVLAASDGQSAIRIFREHGHRIRCVLLDWSMPDLSGEETCAAMQEMQPDARFLFTSGYAREEVEELFPGQSRIGFLQKPFTRDEIVARLRELL